MTRSSLICTLVLVGTFAAFMLIGFPLRFDGAMPWELM